MSSTLRHLLLLPVESTARNVLWARLLTAVTSVLGVKPCDGDTDDTDDDVRRCKASVTRVYGAFIVY